MTKKEMIVMSIALLILVLPLVSAGVGIKWNKESVLVNEGKSECLTYYAYNPWPKQTFVNIELSEELKSIMVMQKTKSILIPENTPSSSAVPMEFCFRVPKNIYPDKCLLGPLICKQECSGELKAFKGEVILRSVPGPEQIASGGGSTTAMSVSAPLNIRVSCTPTGYANRSNLTLLLVIIIILLLAGITLVLKKRERNAKVSNVVGAKNLKDNTKKKRKTEKNK